MKLDGNAAFPESHVQVIEMIQEDVMDRETLTLTLTLTWSSTATSTATNATPLGASRQLRRAALWVPLIIAEAEGQHQHAIELLARVVAMLTKLCR